MPDTESLNNIVLGYHSPTEWVFFPEVAALYNKIVINKEIFDKETTEGHNSASLYKRTKAILLNELRNIGRLIPTEYPLLETQRKKLDQVVDHFFKHYATKIRELMIYAFEAFINHEKATLARLVDPEEPHWVSVTKQLPRLEHIKADLLSGLPLSEFLQLKHIAKRYFEDSILTPIVFDKHYNPVFQWEGYARFEEFLLSFRRDPVKKMKAIKKGAELHVFQSFSDIVVPFRAVRSPDGLNRLVNKWEAFSPIRLYIAKLNQDLWDTIGETSELSEDKHVEFVNDFNSMLEDRMNKLNNQIRQIDEEVEREQASLFSRITRFFIKTFGSIVPGTAGFAQIIDDVYSALVKKKVRNRYPAIRAVFEYERIMNCLPPKRIVSKPITKLTREYKPVIYWDQE